MELTVGPLPDDPLAAAAKFHADWLPRVLALLDSGEPLVTLVFAPARPGPTGLAHAGWRESAVQLLARERTPARINAVCGDDPAAISATAAFIAQAPGLTGQYLVLDGHGAGPVLS